NTKTQRRGDMGAAPKDPWGLPPCPPFFVSWCRHNVILRWYVSQSIAVSARVYAQPFNRDQRRRNRQHIKPKLSAQPIMSSCRSLVRLEHRSIHIRESRVCQIHRNVDPLITL